MRVKNVSSTSAQKMYELKCLQAQIMLRMERITWCTRYTVLQVQDIQYILVYTKC